MTENTNCSFEVHFIVQPTDKAEKKPIRIPYLWANLVVVDDFDNKCPLIEG